MRAANLVVRTLVVPPSRGGNRQAFLVRVAAAAALVAGASFGGGRCRAAGEIVKGVELQPLSAHVQRLVQALELIGAPLPAETRAELEQALDSPEPKDAVAAIQKVLDPLCLVQVSINPESRVKAKAGAAKPVLVEQGWRAFLVKVHNEAGVTAVLRCNSPNAAAMHDAGDRSHEPPATISPRNVRDRWLDVHVTDSQPLAAALSGLELEYRILEVFSRDHGKREAKLAFDVGQGSQDLGFLNEVNLLCECQSSADVQFDVMDVDGQPTVGQFTIRDQQGRVYPARSRRLAPDFFFHDQVYRRSGESVRLPPGTYDVTFTRGPEYRILKKQIEVAEGEGNREKFQLERWINMAARGWYSSDHHVHAAGCSHYTSPTQGVEPADMMRHILGEDLNVGCVLAWGPCWYHQKQFFQGTADPLSTPRHVMRYDVEVSGFPSSDCGHLVLLRLKEDDYPNTKRIEDWPSWNLPILRWAKEQGGIVGYAHSGWGLETPATTTPSYDMPRFDGIGANEYIVDVAHDAIDFISTVDTPAAWELNIWYHTLNCGFTTRISGETDFPCIYDSRVGLGRAYAKLPKGEPLTFDAWSRAMHDGRTYCSDGLTHLFDFQVNDLGVGEAGDQGRPSFLAARAGETLHIGVQAAAFLEPTPREDIRSRSMDSKPYWNVERARVGDTRTVPVELIVNGEAVARKVVAADGGVQEVEFEYPLERSSWVAVRVFPAAHTNPVFVEVDGRPIRASRRSAQWCQRAVDQCWESKSPLIKGQEKADAEQAYDHAREAYRRIEAESFDDGDLEAEPADG